MKKRMFLGVLIICLLIVIILFMLNVIFKNNLELNGDSEVNIKLGEKYYELGLKNIDISKIKISGSVDVSKPGVYEITYEVDKKTIIRKVNVIDDIKPEMKLKGNSDIYLYLGNEYDEDGVVSIDNYDGDISNKVVVKSDVDKNKVGDYLITYTSTDSSSNEAILTRNIHVINKDSNSVNEIPILMYHFFYDDSTKTHATDNNWIYISDFEEQVKYLVDNNYYFPTWKEIELYLDGKIKLPDKSIVITVDDGDPSFFNLGVPVLEKYKVPATSFMITSWYSPSNYKYDSSLISIESHSNNMHRGGCSTGHKGLFQCIDEEKGIQDLKESISVTKSNMVFCYPFGDVNEREKVMLNKTGFHLAVTTKYGKIKPGMDKLELPRIRVSGGNSINYFIKSIN